MYHRPHSLEQACEAVSSSPSTIVCGATDLYAGPRHPCHDRVLVDISRIPSLTGIECHEGLVRIGAGVSWRALRAAPLPASLEGLRTAAGAVGGWQIQSRGTVGGNICHASPAADGIPPLLAADAEVEIASVRGVRRLRLEAFLKSRCEARLAADEILSAILVRDAVGTVFSAFEKLGVRRDLVIAIVSVAVNAELDREGHPVTLRIAVGAASRVPLRLRNLEERLLQRLAATGRASVLPDDLAELSPISDIRATASYRYHAVLVLLNRLLSRIGGEGCP